MKTEMILSPYRIRRTKHGCYSVDKRGRKHGVFVPISLNFTHRQDAELLVVELATGKITERQARKQSAEEN